MNTRARLCHIDTSRCVVEVEWLGAEGLHASALGEGRTAEEAEDRALQRLQARLRPQRTSAPAPVKATPTVQTPPEQETTPDSTAASTAEERQRDVEPQPTPPSEAPTDPDDWSDELTAIDLELQRIGWDREQERRYLERAFGHGSRHRLTRYSDLVAFLNRLRSLEPGISGDQAPVPLRRSDLIQQGDAMLATLSWSPQQAREFLQGQLQASSRQQLSDEQLLQFNMLLEEQLLHLKPSERVPVSEAVEEG
jgi:hypothetical protein